MSGSSRRYLSSFKLSSVGIALVAGSLAVGCSMFVSHDEIGLYRRIRTTTDAQERLVVLSDYAERYPNGAWITEVRAERDGNEEVAWAQNNSTAEGLAFYLQAFPNGTYVEQARARQAALQQVSSGREQTQAREAEVEAQRAQQQAEERRRWVTNAAQFWMRTLVGIQNYGSPIGQVAQRNAEFSRAFGAAPAPQCTPARCVKHYHAHYAIPVPGGNRIEREMHLVLRVVLNQGRAERIEVLFPNHGFSRWYELENRTVVMDEDPEARMAAIEWALARLEPTLAEVATGFRAIDFIPEPISPFGRASMEATGAEDTSTSMDGTAPATPAVAGPTPAAAPAGGAGSGAAEVDPSLEALMSGAVSPDQQPGAQAGAGVAEEEAPVDEQSLVYPLGLRALQRGTTRIVIFAAGDGDYGDAFDGFFIERARD